MKGAEKLLSFHEVNTTVYHPQTDGLVERYNITLTVLLAKAAQASRWDWDKRIPYVLRTEPVLRSLRKNHPSFLTGKRP